MRTNRLVWVDTAKGIGIVAVVAGHVLQDRHIVDGIYLWHMPLFFFLSGYLFSPRPVPVFARQKASHLLLPYLAFLVLLSLPQLLSGDLKHVARMVFGGRTLTGPWGTFWFVPVLYATQQLANALLPRLTIGAQGVLAGGCAAAALLVHPGSLVPLAFDVVLMAFPIFWIGTLCNGCELDARWISAFGVIGLVLSACAVVPPLDMKGGATDGPA